MSPPRKPDPAANRELAEHPRVGRRALLSVSDKEGVTSFAASLVARGYEVISTGGTARALRDAGIAVTDVSRITGFPEIMDGRVKTLHPSVHGGLLARRGIDDAVLAEHGIGMIDLLAVNLYPFEATVARPECTAAEAIENIDVGGPAMLRAAAKNHEHVVVVVDHADYAAVLRALDAGEVPRALRRALAMKAFAHTARYDAAISNYLRALDSAAGEWPQQLTLGWQLGQTLRYGENPHQRAALYRTARRAAGTIAFAAQLQGKELSFNNIVDADAAYQTVKAFAAATACVIIKHANPCGVAIGSTPEAAYRLAYRADPTSAFGGVIAFNTMLDAAAAEAIVGQQFAEVVVAPTIDAGARTAFAKKPSIRVLEAGLPGAPDRHERDFEMKTIEGGLLLQDSDRGSVDVATAKVVTRRKPTAEELRDLGFAWTVVKYVKSNAIVVARGGATLGIGAGQPSRVMSARIAALKAEEAGLELRDAAMSSDAFFPFRDGIDAAAERGIRAVVQPGGSIRDDDVIRAADEHDITMLFTGMRHFRH